MPLFLIERNFAEALDVSSKGIRQILDVNEEVGVGWVATFLSAGGKKTYCLYEAKDPEALREHARVLGLPADVIVEVSRIFPEPH